MQLGNVAFTGEFEPVPVLSPEWPKNKAPEGGAGSFRGLRTAAERVACSQHQFLCLMVRYATPASGAGPAIEGAESGAERSSASAMVASR
jgi:hypothetical protein